MTTPADLRARRYASLPHSLTPRGVDRSAAAVYVGVSVTKFDILVDDGRMPKPRRIDGRKVWDIRELDSAFDALPHDGETDKPLVNEWDEVLGGPENALRS